MTGTTKKKNTKLARDAVKDEVTADVRRRQKYIARILAKTFGPFAKSPPELWQQRTYLMMVGMTYERLATTSKEVPTAELMRLAKLLSGIDRGEQKRGGNHRAPNNAPSLSLPDAVREIYGTNLPAAG